LINTNEDKEEYGKDIKKDFHQKEGKFNPSSIDKVNFDWKSFNPNEGNFQKMENFDPNDEYFPAWEDFDPNDEYFPAWEDFDPNDEYSLELKGFSNNFNKNEFSPQGVKDDTEENFSFQSFLLKKGLLPKMEKSVAEFFEKELGEGGEVKLRVLISRSDTSEERDWDNLV
jgi:hypothetical protein